MLFLLYDLWGLEYVFHRKPVVSISRSLMLFCGFTGFLHDQRLEPVFVVLFFCCLALSFTHDWFLHLPQPTALDKLTKWIHIFMCDLSPLDCIMNIEGNLGSFGSLLYKTSSGSQIFQSRFCCTFHRPWVIHNTQTQSDLAMEWCWLYCFCMQIACTGLDIGSTSWVCSGRILWPPKWRESKEVWETHSVVPCKWE
jgi:hypothetical protein